MCCLLSLSPCRHLIHPSSCHCPGPRQHAGLGRGGGKLPVLVGLSPNLRAPQDSTRGPRQLGEDGPVQWTPSPAAAGKVILGSVPAFQGSGPLAGGLHAFLSVTSGFTWVRGGSPCLGEGTLLGWPWGARGDLNQGGALGRLVAGKPPHLQGRHAAHCPGPLSSGSPAPMGHMRPVQVQTGRGGSGA